MADTPPEASREQLALSQKGPASGSSGLPGLKRDAKKHSPRRLQRVHLPILRSMGSCWKGAALTRIKAHSLTGRINLQSLEESFGCVRRNRGAAGIDRVSIQLYEGQLLQNLAALERRLKDGSYQSLPLRRVHIAKGNTRETCPLGIPAVADRVAQEEVRFLLNPPSRVSSMTTPTASGRFGAVTWPCCAC